MQHANTYVHMRIKLFYMDLIFFLSSVDFLCNMGDFVNIRHLKYLKIKCLFVISELCDLIQLCYSCFIFFLFVFVRVSFVYIYLVILYPGFFHGNNIRCKLTFPENIMQIVKTRYLSNAHA